MRSEKRLNSVIRLPKQLVIVSFSVRILKVRLLELASLLLLVFTSVILPLDMEWSCKVVLPAGKIGRKSLTLVEPLLRLESASKQSVQGGLGLLRYSWLRLKQQQL